MNAAAREMQRQGSRTPSDQHESPTLRELRRLQLSGQFLAGKSDHSSNMSRCTYAEDGGEDDLNTLADPTFDPNSSEFDPVESIVRRGRRGRGVGGRRGRGDGTMPGGRGQHLQGDIVTLPPRARGQVSINFMAVHHEPVPHMFCRSGPAQKSKLHSQQT